MFIHYVNSRRGEYAWPDFVAASPQQTGMIKYILNRSRTVTRLLQNFFRM
jgi:hypothetical protein